MSRRERRLEARRIITEDEKPKETGDVPRLVTSYVQKLPILTIITAFLLLSSLVYIGVFTVQTGDFVRKGVSLAGGTTVTIPVSGDVDIQGFEAAMRSALPGTDLAVRTLRSGTTLTALTLDVAVDRTEQEAIAAVRTVYPDANLSVESTGSSLGETFFRQVLFAVLIAFVLMSIVVFISFRSVIPSLAVILAGFSTIASTLAVFNLFGFSLSTAGVAAFLMLIGYSIDTDILLSTRVLKQDGPFAARLWSAMKTGLTMQMTTAITILAALLLANNDVFRQIMTLLLIGMFFDVIYTWVQNAAILQWYERRKRT